MWASISSCGFCLDSTWLIVTKKAATDARDTAKAYLHANDRLLTRNAFTTQTWQEPRLATTAPRLGGAGTRPPPVAQPAPRCPRCHTCERSSAGKRLFVRVSELPASPGGAARSCGMSPSQMAAEAPSWPLCCRHEEASASRRCGGGDYDRAGWLREQCAATRPYAIFDGRNRALFPGSDA